MILREGWLHVAGFGIPRAGGDDPLILGVPYEELMYSPRRWG